MSREGDSSFVHSITDLMTSLFVVFVLLFVAYINKSYEQTRKESLSVKDTLLRSLKSARIEAENDPKDPLALLIRVRNDNLEFDTNKSIIKISGQFFLRQFVPLLATVLTDKRYANEIESLVIEGYTDSDGDDEHNLRLSQDRSFSVLKYALNESKLSSSQRNYLLDRASTTGRGERDLLPLGSTAGDENKNQSRRVEFKIRIKSFEQRVLASKHSTTELASRLSKGSVE